MGEILNGKNAKITELSLPYSSAAVVALDNTTPYIYVDSFSVSVGTEVNEHELVGTDQKIFSEGVKNAVVNLTIEMEATYNSQNMYEILEAIKGYPTYVGGSMGTGERYFIKIELKNKAASTIAALTPPAASWAACEIGDIDFPSNDVIQVSLTLRYGELTWAAS